MALPYQQVVGPLPLLEADTEAWAAAWQRERARGWTVHTRAHMTMAAIDGASQGNSFRKQMMALPDALVPAADDRCHGLTVVRHEGEVGYAKEAHRLCALAPLSSYVVMPPPYVGRRGFKPPHPLVTTSRYQRARKEHPHLVGWHEVEFPACPGAIRSAHYPRLPPWWPAVEVPFGAMVELPPSAAYLKEMLLANKPWAWNVLRSEWAVMCGAYLVDEYRQDGKLWLFPRALRQWIVRVGLKTACMGVGGPNEKAARELEALLALLDQLSWSTAFTEHLRLLDPSRRDRSSWVRVGWSSRALQGPPRWTRTLLHSLWPTRTTSLRAGTYKGLGRRWGRAARR